MNDNGNQEPVRLLLFVRKALVMILIGMGANLPSRYGAPEETLRACVSALQENNIKILDVSSVWKTAPVPISDQPWYSNAVCSVFFDGTAHDLLKTIERIENAFGRVRIEINAPRSLDLDILAFEGQHTQEDNLSVPHPRMHERAFVLYPLREVAPKWVHPIMNKSVDNLIEQLPKGQEIKRLDGFCLINKE